MRLRVVLAYTYGMSDWVEVTKLNPQQAIIGNWLTNGVRRVLAGGEVRLYPPHQIAYIIIEKEKKDED